MLTKNRQIIELDEVNYEVFWLLFISQLQKKYLTQKKQEYKKLQIT